MTNKGFSILLLFTLVFGGALGAAFAAGVALGKSQGPDPSQETALFRTPRSAQNGGSRPDGFRGGESRLGVEGGVREGGFPRRSDDHASTTDGGSNADGGQGFFGSIAGLQDGVMTVDSPQFGQMLAIISEGTAVQKTVAGSVDDLVVGIDVRIQGRRVEDGPVQARTITLVTDASEGFSGPDGGGRRGFSGGLSVSGTIERIEEGLMTVATADGTSQVAVDDETTIQKIEAGERADLVEGAAVRVLGSPNEEGMLQASLVILVPDGFFRYSRRGSLDGARQPQ
ncbi:MAG: hypothetical protein IIC99_05395 [Chloroflexi bacterium]|nr:hypothetical protein [Chloroflexota bacterium]